MQTPSISTVMEGSNPLPHYSTSCLPSTPFLRVGSLSIGPFPYTSCHSIFTTALSHSLVFCGRHILREGLPFSPCMFRHTYSRT